MDNTLTTSSGKKWKVLPVSQETVVMAQKAIEERYKSQGLTIDPPTYTYQTAGGGSIVAEHNETTLETEEDKARWKVYQDNINKLTAEKADLQMRMWLTLGLDIDESIKDPAWEQTQAFFGVVIPTNPIEKRLHFVKTEVLKSPYDIGEFIRVETKLAQQGAVSEEEVDAAIDIFLSQAFARKKVDLATGTPEG